MRRLPLVALAVAMLSLWVTLPASAHHREGHRGGHGRGHDRGTASTCLNVLQQYAQTHSPVLLDILLRNCDDDEALDRVAIVLNQVVVLPDDHRFDGPGEHPSCRGLRRAAERSSNPRVAYLAWQRGC
jgi:hypothetical protein